MSTCNTALPPYQSENGDIEIIEKYQELMAASLADDSIYARSKQTFYELFDKLNINETEKAQVVASNITQMTTTMSSVAMQTALSWAKENRDGAYTLSKLKAETELAIANTALTEQKICTEEKQTALICAQIESTLASSIRENGKVASYDADGCKPLSLNEEGLKYEQTKQVMAATYQSYADAYRKSGVVQIGEDITDNYMKGLSGDGDGYTWQQIQFSERQRLSFEDSKINHAVNSSASMIGQMLTAEITPDVKYMDLWVDAMNRLLDPHSSTPMP